ncbi:YcgN family cysteine cluster protein [bacterium]|nr:YcgN family cysteine cluster protein [bacterium]
MVEQTTQFWEEKTLEELTPAEWEALCDGCGKCCLHKIEDVETGKVYYTNVACRLLDTAACRCTDYANRSTIVTDCVPLTPARVREIGWLPATCAYCLLAEGKPLPWWHPLRSGDPKTVRKAGVTVCGKVVPEQDVDLNDLEDMVVDWFD